MISIGYSEEVDSDTDSKLVSSDNKINLEKYVGLWYEYELNGLKYNPKNATFYFYLINNSNETIENIRLIPSSLTADKRPTYSNASSYLGSDSITIDPTNIPSLPINETRKISYTISTTEIKKLEYNEVAFDGQLQIISENAAPMAIPVIVSFRVDGYADLGFAILGVVAAVFAGLAYMRWEQSRKIEEEANDDAEIIGDINGHIRSINAFKNTFEPEAWNNIYLAYNEKRSAIEKYRDLIDLNREAEAVKWFSLIDDQIREGNLDLRNTAVNNHALPEIDKPEGDNYEELKEAVLEERKHEQYIKDKDDWGKRVYLLAAGIIASIAALITEVSFHGNSALNLGIAAAIGFGVYRAQDLLKLFPGKTEE